MVIISPHLDDAVFGCGQLMATNPGATVVTVFAGFPSEDASLPDWDAQCGFRSPQEAVMARREEDRRALSMLGARPVWLDFLDSQYGHSPSVLEVSRALTHVLSDLDPEWVLVPFGLYHSDHMLVHDAALTAVWGLSGERRVGLYEDLPYRNRRGLLQERLAMLKGRGVTVTPDVVHLPAHDGLKTRAAAAYASQLKVLGEKVQSQLHGAERVWDLERPASVPAVL